MGNSYSKLPPKVLSLVIMKLAFHCTLVTEIQHLSTIPVFYTGVATTITHWEGDLGAMKGEHKQLCKQPCYDKTVNYTMLETYYADFDKLKIDFEETCGTDCGFRAHRFITVKTSNENSINAEDYTFGKRV